MAPVILHAHLITLGRKALARETSRDLEKVVASMNMELLQGLHVS
jgi:hypothetical protein